jgi:uncharacterized membrane protein
MVLALVVVRFVYMLDTALGWQMSLNPETARTVLGSLAGAMFTFVVFVCSSLLLVVQLASAQLTPRVIGTMFRDPVTKLTLAVFVFTFTFLLAAIIRIDAAAPTLITHIAVYSCVVSVAAFLFMVDHIGKLLRPSGAFRSIASEAHAVINAVYPQRFAESPTGDREPAAPPDDRPAHVVFNPTAGVVLALDVAGLAALGAAHDCAITLVPQVGDFVAPGDPLFRVHGGDVPERALLHSIALGAERTMEQDPAFAFRMIVDIASKGLSPAINDPTTAVLAVDRIHHLLRHVGGRCLQNATVRDAAGRVRLMYRTPDWEDFVSLAVTEIRQFGSTSIQIARRLRAMLDDLIATLPPERTEMLRQELKVLRKSAPRYFQEPEDLALAEVSDSQGVGGAHNSRPRPESAAAVGSSP